MQASTAPSSNKCHLSPTCPPIPLFKTPHSSSSLNIRYNYTAPFHSLTPLSVAQENQASTKPDHQLHHRAMAEHRQQDQQQQQQRGGDARGLLQEKGPSKQQILAVVAGVPLGGFFMLLSGLTLTGTIIGLALTTPLFVICSPVLVPAFLTIALAVAGFLASGAFGITALSSLSWIINYLRRSGQVPQSLEQAKRRAQETAGQIGQKAREAGQKAEEKTRS